MYRFKYLACGFALLVAGCSSDNSVTTPTSTTTLTVDFTDATNGPLTPYGSQTFSFGALAAGQVSVELLALNPDFGATVGLALGVLDSAGACQRVVANDRVTRNQLVVAQASQAGTLCASIYDATGSLPGPETFDIQIIHP